MIRIVFKNLEKSEPLRDIATEKVLKALNRFSEDRPRNVSITLEKENAPAQRGVDAYKVKIELVGGKYHGVILEKSAGDVYTALALVLESLVEKLNRYTDRLRTKNLKPRKNSTSQRRRFAGLSD